jgi:gamma-glutamyl hercynylcysteine S-oxide synthase
MNSLKKELELTTDKVISLFLETRERELKLMENLSREQLLGPSMKIIEPPIWELGHVGWFQDRWVLQGLDGLPPHSDEANNLYDSYRIPNNERWDLAFPSLAETTKYITEIFDKILLRMKTKELSKVDLYFYQLCLNHEDMHSETMVHIRQSLKYPDPMLGNTSAKIEIDESFTNHDVQIQGGEYLLGGLDNGKFLFDNEKWAHKVSVAPFSIAVLPVTVGDYMEFVEDGGYQNQALWENEGLVWVQKESPNHPLYWQKIDGEWQKNWFDTVQSLNKYHPMMHVNWYEANAYCKWAGRKLPTEAEWEIAASYNPDNNSIENKNHFPWGNDDITNEFANLNGISNGLVDVRAFTKGDSAFGLRQMIGNVWEWTSSTFDAFPGYVIDPYDTYSEPSFGQQKVLRGGCWTTRPHVIRNTFRNFYTPNRNNIFAGFRTVKL